MIVCEIDFSCESSQWSLDESSCRLCHDRGLSNLHKRKYCAWKSFLPLFLFSIERPSFYLLIREDFQIPASKFFSDFLTLALEPDAQALVAGSGKSTTSHLQQAV